MSGGWANGWSVSLIKSGVICTLITTHSIHFLPSEWGSVPAFIAAASCTILGGQLADFLLSRNLLRLITVRKLFSSLGKSSKTQLTNPFSTHGQRFLDSVSPLLRAPPSITMCCGPPFVASSYTTTIILLILIPGTSNLCDSGFIINTLDVAPW